MLARAFVRGKFFDTAFFDAVASAVASTAHGFTTRELAEMSWALGRAFQTFSVRAANAATVKDQDAVPRSHRDALGAHVRRKPVRQEVRGSVLGLAVRIHDALTDTLSSWVCFCCAAPGARGNRQAQPDADRANDMHGCLKRPVRLCVCRRARLRASERAHCPPQEACGRPVRQHSGAYS